MLFLPYIVPMFQLPASLPITNHKYIKFVILLQNAREYEKKYNDYVNHRSQDLVGIEEAPFGYDGVWTIALALQEAERRLQEIGKIH